MATQYLDNKGNPTKYLDDNGNEIVPIDTPVGPKIEDTFPFTGPEDTRSGARKFLDAHPIVERLLTGTNPQMEEMKKLKGVPEIQGPGLMSIPGLTSPIPGLTETSLADKVKNTGINTGNYYGGFLGDVASQLIGLAEGGFDPRTAGIKTGVVPQSTVALGQDLAKLKIPATDATVEGTLKPLLEANRAKTTVFPEPKVGEPPYNTSQFGLAPSSEALPYPLNVTPNRLRPPSTNATVFNALVPERYKTNAQGAFSPPTEEIVKPIQVERKLPSPETVKSEYGRLISSQDNEALTGAEAKLKDFKARMGDETGAMFVGRDLNFEDLYNSLNSEAKYKAQTSAQGKLIPFNDEELNSLRSKLPKTFNVYRALGQDEINNYKNGIFDKLKSASLDESKAKDFLGKHIKVSGTKISDQILIGNATPEAIQGLGSIGSKEVIIDPSKVQWNFLSKSKLLGDETGAMYIGNFGKAKTAPKQIDLVEGLKRGQVDYKNLSDDQIEKVINLIENETSPEILKENLEHFQTEYEWSKLHGTPDDIELAGSFRDSALDRAKQLQASGDSRFKKLLGGEEGVLRLRGKTSSETNDIRSSIIKAVSSGGKLNIAEIYKPFSSDVTPKQFSKIVDDILESGDLQRAYEGTRAANQARLMAPMQSKPTSLSDAISNLKNAVNQHITARATQDAMVAEEKAARAGKLAGIEGQGVEGFSKKSQALKGEYPKVPIEPVKEAISQIDLDELMNAPEKAFTDQFQKYRAQNAIAKVFGITGDRTPLQPNEIKLLQQTFGNEMADQLAQLHGGIALVADANPEFHKISELANLSKSIQSSTDFSAPLRQGLPMLLRSEFYPNFVKMFKYAGSENSYKNLQSYLANEWPERELARKSGLSISQIGTDIGPKEEHFLSGAPEKVPVLGKIYRGSERAYVGFIDKMRSDVFTSMINDLRKAGIQTETKISLKNGKEILVPTAKSKAVARYVNVATGRGSLSMTLPQSLGGKTISAEKYGDLLNSVFYSPRFQASRIQLITDPLFQWNTLPKTVRKEYLKSLLAVGGFVTTANGLGYALGGKLTSNPTSSDFGKIVSGPRNMTRTDPGGGWLQYLTLAAQLALNEKTNPVTGDTRVLGEGYKPTTRGDVVEQFGRYKLAPIPQYLWSAFTGKNAIGQDFDASSEAAKLVVPLVAQDIYDILKEDPSLASLGNSIPAIFGVGLNTFEEYKKKPKDESVKKTNILDSLTR